jgi:hypothetical protein
MNTAPMWLIYEDDDGETVTRHYQPWQDIATAGVLINDIGNDMTLVGWTTEAPGGSTEKIVVESRDGELIVIEVDTSAERPIIYITDPHESSSDRVEVFINGVDYSPDSF